MSSQSAIPTARVNRIIKADKDVRLCSKEAVFLISKAAERMIEKTAEQSYQTARLQKRNVKMVRYEHLASVAHQPEWFYLAEVIPNSIPLSTALNLKRHSLDVAEGQSAATTSASGSGPGVGVGTGAAAAGSTEFTGKRVVKSKSRKSTGISTASSGAAEELLATDRTTRGIKLQLPAGEGEDEDDDDLNEGGDLEFRDGDYRGEGAAESGGRGTVVPGVSGAAAVTVAPTTAVSGAGPGPIAVESTIEQQGEPERGEASMEVDP